MERTFALLGCTFSFLGVALGAFAAHALETRLEPRAIEIFETGVRYQTTHALALLVLALMLIRWPGGLGEWAGWAFVGGIVVFSGSLYVLALTGVRTWGAVTPLGGLLFLAGWVLLGTHLLRS
jgi:uncharacterized membrane protein YgdD (TMEM256/DUF423 family)